MIRYLKFLILCATLLPCSSIYARTYYVAPKGGSDFNPGTISSPWATWQKAFTTPVAGDTVFFRGGIWYPTKPAAGNNIIQIMPDNGMGHNGEPGNPICFFAYPPDYNAGNIPILDCSLVVAPGSSGTNRYLTGIMMYDVHFHKWKGLTIRNIYQRERYVDIKAVNSYPASNMHYEGITIYNIGGAGWFMNHVVGDERIASLKYGWDGSGYIPYDTTSWINCDTYQCCDSFPANLGQVPGNMSDAFKIVSFPKPGYYTYDGCRAWHCGDDGFDTPNGSSTVILKNCWSFYHLYPGFSMEGNGFKVPTGNYEGDLITTAVQMMTNCISAFNNCGLYTPEGAVITYPGKWKIYNNTFYSNTVGIVMDNLSPFDTTKSYWYNNIVYKTYQKDAAGRPAYVDARRYYYESNNTFDFADDNEIGSLPWWKPSDDLRVTDDDFIMLDSIQGLTQLMAPRKKDGSLPDITFLKLAQGSDLIDAGINVGLPYSGNAPDIGYSEYSSGSLTIPIPYFLNGLIKNDAPAILEITYNLTLANIVPASSAFAVKVNSVARAVNSVAISGTKVLLTLSSPVVYGDVVTVAYTKPASNPLQTPAGGQAASLAAQSAINNCSPIANQPPQVTITSPTKSLTVVEPANITVEATATDTDGFIARVEFFSSNTKLGEATTTPYSYTWKNVLAGTYTIFAIATDNSGSKTISEAATIIVEKSAQTVNQLPVIDVKYTTRGKSGKPKKNDTIVLTATAYDPDGTILNVEFKNGNATLAIDTTLPFSHTLQDVDTGTYIITAIATDNRFASTVSLPLVIDVTETGDDLANILLSPNPTNGKFVIDIQSDLPVGDKRIKVIDLTGNIVYEDVLADNETFREFDLSAKVPGTYILAISGEKRIIGTKKFIKR